MCNKQLLPTTVTLTGTVGTVGHKPISIQTCFFNISFCFSGCTRTCRICRPCWSQGDARMYLLTYDPYT